jgi:hypothetical protein
MRIQERDVSVELPNNSRAVVRFVRAGSRRNSFNTYTLEGVHSGNHVGGNGDDRGWQRCARVQTTIG